MSPGQNGPLSTPARSGDAAPVACRERTDGSARNWPLTGTPFPAKRRDDVVSHDGRTRALRLREPLLRPLKLIPIWKPRKTAPTVGARHEVYGTLSASAGW